MTAERKWFLGVDGGQSSTVAAIGDETGAVKGVGKAGPCNHVSAGESRERFLHAVGGAVRAAEEAAGLSMVRYEAACLGFSGGPHDKEAPAREAVKAARYLITSDAHIALTGATAGEPGIIAIAGTGSIAYGRNAAGKTARAGGWGYAMGDEGSAFDLVRQALRAILRFDEGWGPATSLRDASLSATGARDASDLLHRFYTPEYPRSRVASYAPLVDEAARHGDAVAREILLGAAQALATYVAAVRRQLFHRGEPSQVSYIGGVFASDLLRERFHLIAGLEGDSRVHAPLYGPAAGALLEAYRLAGLHVLPTGAPTGA
ncbi:MAG TPA: BadF/BadG/BcrA/BcrD ATPase family protein [Bryobacteraceae bacterium]|nr:BadF/BadG/BcrA/BcrD ATPase family protein [Bryobacteraceae bacterium]